MPKYKIRMVIEVIGEHEKELPPKKLKQTAEDIKNDILQQGYVPLGKHEKIKSFTIKKV